MDFSICQTSTASPAEPGGSPFVLRRSLCTRCKRTKVAFESERDLVGQDLN